LEDLLGDRLCRFLGDLLGDRLCRFLEDLLGDRLCRFLEDLLTSCLCCVSGRVMVVCQFDCARLYLGSDHAQSDKHDRDEGDAHSRDDVRFHVLQRQHSIKHKIKEQTMLPEGLTCHQCSLKIVEVF